MNDADLLRASGEGDADAFAAFYRRHLPLVTSACLRLTGDRELAADMVSEVFAAALASCRRYVATHPTADPWLVGIAHNKFRESLRRRRVQDAVRRRLRMRPVMLVDEDLERVEELAALGFAAVRHALQALPIAEREAIQARIVQERGYHEIAAELRCSESVVRQRVSRGLARARDHLAQSETQEAGP
jgi:RNA polymerase sigma factor (sigma-70 family)